MNARFGADDGEPRDLAEFEAELRRVLEQRLVAAAQSPRQPTDDEAEQLARMTAHMAMTDLARRARPLRPVPSERGMELPSPAVAKEIGAVAHGPRPSRLTIAVPKLASHTLSTNPQRTRRHSLLVTTATMAAVALGVVLVRGVVQEAGPDAPATVDVAARVPDGTSLHPNDDVYLGDAKSAGGTSVAFSGRVTWDTRGQDGVVRVVLFDLDGDPHQALSEQHVEGAEWTPAGPLPRRFRVVVDRPADDGVSREELLCADYFMP